MSERPRQRKLDSLLEQAETLHRAERLQEAKSAYKRVLRFSPGNDAALNGLGMLYGQLDDIGQAEQMFRRAISIRPDAARYHINLGVTLKRAGRPSEAIECYVRALEREPDNVDGLCNLGSVLVILGRATEAIGHLRKATALRPESAAPHRNLAIALYAEGDLQGALGCARAAVRVAPFDADAHNDLGLILHAAGRLDDAENALRRSISLDARNAPAHNNLGLVHQARGDADLARDAFKAAVTLQPSYADAWANLGGTLAKLRDFPAALRCFDEALSRIPGDERVLVGRANALRDAGRDDEAVEALRTIIGKFPDSVLALGSLGTALLSCRRYEMARSVLEHLVAGHPGDALAHNNLGLCHWAIGDADRAIQCFRRAVALNPESAEARGNLVLNLNYVPWISRDELYAEHRRAGEQIEAKLGSTRSPHRNARDPERTLKIGYVSGDFCEHAVSFFTEPVIARHDKERFEVFCLSAGGPSDETTDRFKARADHWISLAGMSEDRAAARIRDLEIDILIDLSGHTALNRLPLFARKPAPVQVHWLGYVNTTGLTSIDFRLTDRILDPIGEADRYYTERLVRLPIVSAFEPPRLSSDPGPLPCLSTGTFTFACLNRAAKITPKVVETWATILRRVPDSLLMLAKSDADVLEAAMIDAFGRHGIPPPRLRFVPKVPLQEYFALHREIDLCLDPFPYNGGATSCHALWMAVPFVALRGDRYMARMGMDLLENVGLRALTADDHEGYVEIAVGWASRRGELAEIRGSLRERLLESPLGRPRDFTASLEAAYISMWRAWCADPAPGFSHRAQGIDAPGSEIR